MARFDGHRAPRVFRPGVLFPAFRFAGLEYRNKFGKRIHLPMTFRLVSSVRGLAATGFYFEE